MAKIVSIGQLSDDKISELAEAGIEIEDSINLDKLNLPEINGYNETFFFHADEMETQIYVEMHKVTVRLEKWSRELLGDAMTRMGKKIRSSDITKAWYEQLSEDKMKPKFDNDEQEEEFFRLCQRKTFLHSLLYWKIGERGNLHSYRLGIRKPSSGDDKLRVVKVQRRVDFQFGSEDE